MCIHTVKDSSIHEVVCWPDPHIPGNYKSQSSLPHWHRAVHLRAAFLQAHLPLQPFLHPHRSSSLDDTAASGRVVHTGFQFDGSVQPQFSGDGISGAASVALPQQCPPWYTALLICWTRAALVGGRFYIVRPFFVNNSNRASSMSVKLLVRS